MRKADYFLIFISIFLMVWGAGKDSFSWQCVGPANTNCLQCHAGAGGGTSGANPYPDGYLHLFHDEGIACSACHCGEVGTSPCEPSSAPVDTHCCTACHDECFEVDEHTSNLWFDCASCHYSFDTDADSVTDCLDNCPEMPNGPILGTCVKTKAGMVVSYRAGDPKDFITCTSDTDCEATDGTCQLEQGDCDGNGIGDVCECYANFNFNDLKVTGSDLAILKKEYGSFSCSPSNPCYADGNGDGKVTGSDLSLLKNEYGRFDCPACTRPIGVIFVVHGGADTHRPQLLWDAGMQQFSYDPNHSVYKLVIWNPNWWSLGLQSESSIKFIRKYDFEYPRIGGTDPFRSLTEQQLTDMETELDSNTYGINFEVDWAGWMCGDCVNHYSYPRFMYYGPDGPGVGNNCTYCGEDDTENAELAFDNGTAEFNVGATLTGQTSGATGVIDKVTVNSGSWVGGDAAGYLTLSSVSGTFQDNETIVDDGTSPGSALADGTIGWYGCDPDRYDVDGPVERLLKKGVSRIIMVDLTVGGPRFSKTYDVVQMTTRVVDEWKTEHGISIPLTWINDYSNLMERSFPIQPVGWTRSLGMPDEDSHVLLNGSPNPITSDTDLATLFREAIEAGMSGSVSDANTGIIILNHALHDNDEVFDPKMDDTIVLNENIKDELLVLHPTMDPDNIIGARMGIKEVNDEAEHTLEERTREMRGENLGQQWLYESDKEPPGDEWGYFYWDALEYLKDRGVEHIVIGFTQIVTDSVLNLVEIPNQIGKEIGVKNWLKDGTWDYTTYPIVGHPFADYWGNWVYTDCGEWELQFDNGTEEIAAGGLNPTTLEGAARLIGDTSGAEGVIKQVIVESGSWDTNDAAGKIILKDVVGSFSDGEIIYDDKGDPGSALANGTATQTISTDCCFEMGGCADDPLPRPYSPPRLTPLPDRRHDMDPSLAYDLSDYGHLGYDPGMGAPDPNNPVQDQYTGTWEMYVCPSDDPRMGQLLAKHVINAAVKPMVYLTNGNLEGITVGGSVTFEAHVSGGEPGYTYQWSIKEAGDPDWTTVGGNSSTWTWNPGGGDEGTYEVRCKVTDSRGHIGEVIWEGFVVSTP